MKNYCTWKGKAIKTILIHTNVSTNVYTKKSKIYKKAGNLYIHNINYAPFVEQM